MPYDNLSYHWSRKEPIGTNSETIIYTAHAPSDFGPIFCRAKNSIGLQRDPCIVRLVPIVSSAQQEAPSLSSLSCADTNRTESAIYVNCSSGKCAHGDYGLKFRVELLDSRQKVLLKNVTFERVLTCGFWITSLAPGATYVLQIHAAYERPDG